MTLKLEGDRYILKMYPHTENEADILRHPKLESIEKYENVSRSKVKVKMSKAPNYSQRYIVTDIPIKPQQFPTSSF